MHCASVSPNWFDEVVCFARTLHIPSIGNPVGRAPRAGLLPRPTECAEVCHIRLVAALYEQNCKTTPKPSRVTTQACGAEVASRNVIAMVGGGGGAWVWGWL